MRRIQESAKGRLLHAKFHPIGAGVGRGPQNCKFYKISEYKRPAGAYLWAILTKFSAFVVSFMLVYVLKFG